MERVIRCCGTLTRQVVEKLIGSFESFSAESLEPIVLRFDSPGGDTHATLELARLIEQSGLQTIGVAKRACSGAALVFAACKLRIVQSGGIIGIHMPKVSISCVDVDDLGRLSPPNAEAVRILKSETLRILRSRLRVSDKEFASIVRSRCITYFDATQAVQAGLADEIAP